MIIRQAQRWPSVRFLIAGKGEEEQVCRKLSADLKCENVEFLGHLPLARLGEAMRRAEIFFFPSTTEGHPQVLGQAAACGLPVIARKIYRPDYVVDGVTGMLANEEDQLSAHLDTLIRQPELRKKMGAAAVDHAGGFKWDEIVQRWAGLFTSVHQPKH